MKFNSGWAAIVVAFFSLGTAEANGLAPPAYNDAKGRRIVFADFEHAEHTIDYDIDAKVARFSSVIRLRMPETGHLVFDLVDEPKSVSLGNSAVPTELVSSPSRETSYRITARPVPAGLHVLRVEGTITRSIAFVSGGVRSSFWMSDLSDRRFLEAYLPSNLEYDQLKLVINARLRSASGSAISEHAVFSNATNILRAKRAQNEFRLEYPETYTSSSPYFHIGPKAEYEVLRDSYRSTTGRIVPLVIYAQALRRPASELRKARDESLKSLKELEEIYGPYPHDSLVVYVTGASGGGMEYSGATTTSLWALSHEIAHSWFARGVMPANGNAGWLDEAITSWRDNGYPRRSTMSGQTPLADSGTYMRQTHQGAYGFGANFIAHLHAIEPNFVRFLSEFFRTRAFKPLTTEEFSSALSQFAGKDYELLFRAHVYRRPGERVSGRATRPVNNPYHPVLSPEDIQKML